MEANFDMVVGSLPRKCVMTWSVLGMHGNPFGGDSKMWHVTRGISAAVHMRNQTALRSKLYDSMGSPCVHSLREFSHTEYG